MFSSLSKKITAIIDTITNKKTITEADLDTTLREIKIALLEADVSIIVIKSLLKDIKEKAINQKVLSGIKPSEQIIKIVNDELVAILGNENTGLSITKTPFIILMVGLNGAGKTTTTAKLAKFISEKHNKKILAVSTDIYRPQAKEQLELWGQKLSFDTLPIIENETPTEIINRALKIKNNYDVMIIDTAGRVHIDNDMMGELNTISQLVKPDEIFMCSDALVGQDAVNIAKEFNDLLHLTGIIITRIDGDARGGNVLSMKQITGVPIRFLSTGETADDFELFHPERIANRILGMGDIVSLVEQAEAKINKDEAQKLAENFMSGKFTFNDFLLQIKQMKKMGNLSGIMKFLPNLGGLDEKLSAMGMDDEGVKKQEAMILSMTPTERLHPEILLLGRKKRLAKGAGVSLSDVEKLMKQYTKIKTSMEAMNKMGGIKGLFKMAKQLTGSNFENLNDLQELGKLKF